MIVNLIPVSLFIASCYLTSGQFEVNFYPNLVFTCYRPQRSWGKVIFSEACVKNSVHGGEGGPSPHPGRKLWGLARGLQAHTQGKLRGLAGRGLFPGPHPGGFQAQGGVSQHALRQTPPSRQLLLRAVCMLLECILV